MMMMMIIVTITDDIYCVLNQYLTLCCTLHGLFLLQFIQ